MSGTLKMVFFILMSFPQPRWLHIVEAVNDDIYSKRIWPRAMPIEHEKRSAPLACAGRSMVVLPVSGSTLRIPKLEMTKARSQPYERFVTNESLTGTPAFARNKFGT